MAKFTFLCDCGRRAMKGRLVCMQCMAYRNLIDWEGFNFRYAAYCVSHCLAPDAMLEHDRERWPGGVMCGFILWVAARWREWEIERRYPHDAPKSDEQHADFDQWLADRVLPLGG